MPEPVKVLRLHREIYLPLLFAARSAAIPVEQVIEIALRRFGSLSLEERTNLLREHRLAPGYQTAKAKRCSERMSWFGNMMNRAAVALRRLLGYHDSG